MLSGIKDGLKLFLFQEYEPLLIIPSITRIDVLIQALRGHNWMLLAHRP